MSVETENKFLYIRTNMPNISQWNPIAAAKYFINERVRRKLDKKQSSGKETIKRQNYFKGIFAEAKDYIESDKKSDTDSDVEESVFDF